MQLKELLPGVTQWFGADCSVQKWRSVVGIPFSVPLTLGGHTVPMLVETLRAMLNVLNSLTVNERECVSRSFERCLIEVVSATELPLSSWIEVQLFIVSSSQVVIGIFHEGTERIPQAEDVGQYGEAIGIGKGLCVELFRMPTLPAYA